MTTHLKKHIPRYIQFALIGCILYLFSIVPLQSQSNTDKKVLPSNHPISSVFGGAIQIPTQKGEQTLNAYEKSTLCPTQEVNRSIDGSCNNIDLNSTAPWGAAEIPLDRAVNDVYNSNNDLVGQNRKNPREISNIIFEQDCGSSSSRLSSFVFTWGQFLDHDITLTPEDEDLSEPILPVPNDIITAPIPFHRSEAFPGTGGTGQSREQRNNLTAWIDASNVYGSDYTRANYLRTFTDGKLKTSNAVGGGDLLPFNTVNNQSGSTLDGTVPFMAGSVEPGGTYPSSSSLVEVFVAGDVRANEQPGLTALHTLFVREHNRICDQLIASGMNNDEAIYQRARKEVGAIIQSITYNEFLTALGVQMPTYGGYDNSVRPDIINVFATAAFRLGHTMVTDNLVLYDDNGNNTGSLTLAQSFFNPGFIADNGIEGILNGLAQQFQEETDAQIVENLRSFLFTPTPTGPGLDLAALNIQRGRDHGLADYNTFRQAFGIPAATSFADISSDPLVQTQLSDAYNGNVNNIDVWVGLLAEDQLPNAAIGQTLNAILADQFARLRDGDFYYFENDPAFTATQRNTINNTTLSDVIKRNSNISNIKNQVFYAPCPINQNVTNDVVNSGNRVYKTSSSITASNLVDNTSSAVYDATLEVCLLPGFDAQTGSEFHALINGCDSGSFNKTQTEKTPSLANTFTELQALVYPNPFEDHTNIQFQLNEKSEVKAYVTDVNGKLLAQLLQNQTMEVGTHYLNFDATDLPSGMYVLKIETPKYSITKKMLIH